MNIDSREFLVKREEYINGISLLVLGDSDLIPMTFSERLNPARQALKVSLDATSHYFNYN